MAKESLPVCKPAQQCVEALNAVLHMNSKLHAVSKVQLRGRNSVLILCFHADALRASLQEAKAEAQRVRDCQAESTRQHQVKMQLCLLEKQSLGYLRFMH